LPPVSPGAVSKNTAASQNSAVIESRALSETLALSKSRVTGQFPAVKPEDETATWPVVEFISQMSCLSQQRKRFSRPKLMLGNKNNVPSGIKKGR
jgi:hypothetical protein